MSATEAETPKLLVEVSPHVKDSDSTSRIMWLVAATLTPAAGYGVYVFGARALWLIVLSVISAMLIEAVCQWFRGRMDGGRTKITVSDGSAAVTGLLLAMVLPSTCEWYAIVTGNFFAIAIAKQAFGGLGCNIFNPALVGRAALQACYPVMVNTSFKPTFWDGGADTVTGPTMLAGRGAAFFGNTDYLADMFLGNQGGAMGETSSLLLLAGGLVLIALGIVNWRVPVVYLASVFALIWILPVGAIGKASFAGPEWAFQHLFAGGLMIGAFFMATDMVTSPITDRGLVIFALGCGVLTAIIRLYGGFPEGVCYSILLMNTAAPIIDRHTRPRIFGAKRSTK